MEFIKNVLEHLNQEVLRVEKIGLTNQSRSILLALTEALKQAIKAA